MLLVAMLCAACAGGAVEPEIKFKPTFLPVSLGFGPSGVSVEGDDELMTPIGEFSIGASYELPTPAKGSIYVILRNRKTGYDRIFRLTSGSDQFAAVVNGTTSISVVNDQVTIDVTSGTINKVAFRQVAQPIAEEKSESWLTALPGSVVNRWDEGWQQSWYKPFALARWAYDDSTIEKWYGVGFVWFMLRLALAVLLAAVDLALTLGFLVGQFFFLIFGPTGRDIVYGLMILVAIGGTVAMASG
jgi:hypothetical protein